MQQLGNQIYFSAGKTNSNPKKSGNPKVEILDPADPTFGQQQQSEAAPASEEEVAAAARPPPKSPWRHGFKRILGSVSGLCNKVSTLMLKFVSTVFPWNRRAKRRLQGGDDDE